MKIYKTLEDGTNRYYSNKRDAQRNANKAYRQYNRGDIDGHSSEYIQKAIIPTDKVGLINWLNNNAYCTGWTSE